MFARGMLWILFTTWAKANLDCMAEFGMTLEPRADHNETSGPSFLAVKKELLHEMIYESRVMIEISSP